MLSKNRGGVLAQTKGGWAYKARALGSLSRKQEKADLKKHLK